MFVLLFLLLGLSVLSSGGKIGYDGGGRRNLFAIVVIVGGLFAWQAFGIAMKVATSDLLILSADPGISMRSLYLANLAAPLALVPVAMLGWVLGWLLRQDDKRHVPSADIEVLHDGR